MVSTKEYDFESPFFTILITLVKRFEPVCKVATDFFAITI